MTKFMKPAAIMLILAGAAAGTLLFISGAADDAPGLSLIGLAAAFLLIMSGVYKAGAITKNSLAAVLLLCSGAGAVLMSAVLLIDGEFGESPCAALTGAAAGAALIASGTVKKRNSAGK